jgi:hypothetical protein
MRDRLSRMTWMVGLSMAWNTVLTGVLVGIVLSGLARHDSFLPDIAAPVL